MNQDQHGLLDRSITMHMPKAEVQRRQQRNLVVLHVVAPKSINQTRIILAPPEESVAGVVSASRLVIGRPSRSASSHSGGTTRCELAAPLLSRKHAELFWQKGRLYIQDLGSLNGTWANGRKLGDQTLQLNDQDVLRLADVLLVVETGVDRDTARELIDGSVLFEPHSDAARGCFPGYSRHCIEVSRAIKRMAPRPESVFICGPTGSGKEAIARGLHGLSDRKGEYITANCAEISNDLASAALFGHVKGAFTGAQQTKKGLFELAHGGTLFLDEIAELPLEQQAKLLRVLDSGELHVLGKERAVQVDVRLVTASHKDLETLVAHGSFRADLYARLSALQLGIEGLEARRADILAWLDYFNLSVHGSDPRPQDLSVEEQERILLGDWPLNLRQLRKLALDPQMIPVRDAQPEQPTPAGSPDGHELADRFQAFGGNISELARYYQRDRKQIYRWLKRHGIHRHNEP